MLIKKNKFVQSWNCLPHPKFTFCTIPIFLLFHLLSFYYFFPPLPSCTMPISTLSFSYLSPNLHNTNTFTFLSFSKYFSLLYSSSSLFSYISSLILQCIFIFIYLNLYYLPFLGYWLSYLSLSPLFVGDNFFSSCFHISSSLSYNMIGLTTL